MKKIAVVVTNQATYGDSKERTGLWLAEAADFVMKMQAAGYQADYISPQGGKVPLDPRSLKRLYVSPKVGQFWQSRDFYERCLTHSIAARYADPGEYEAAYFTGGHGVVWDFPTSPALQQLAEGVYAHGGYITSVCHGLAGLLNLKDAQGGFAIAGKRITGFTREEELLSGKYRLVPFITESEAHRRGAHFTKRLPFTPYAVRDGRYITGQNPSFGGKVADLLLAALADRYPA